MRRAIGKAYGWKHPRVPAMKFTILFEGRWPEVLRLILEVAVEEEVHGDSFGDAKGHKDWAH